MCASLRYSYGVLWGEPGARAVIVREISFCYSLRHLNSFTFICVSSLGTFFGNFSRRHLEKLHQRVIRVCFSHVD